MSDPFVKYCKNCGKLIVNPSKSQIFCDSKCCGVYFVKKRLMEDKII